MGDSSIVLIEEQDRFLRNLTLLGAQDKNQQREQCCFRRELPGKQNKVDVLECVWGLGGSCNICAETWGTRGPIAVHLFRKQHPTC